MKTIVTAMFAGGIILATASPGFALMKGNPVNPSYKSKYSAGSGAAAPDMAKQPRSGKMPKRR